MAMGHGSPLRGDSHEMEPDQTEVSLTTNELLVVQVESLLPAALPSGDMGASKATWGF